MKKLNMIFALAALIIGGLTFTSCDSTTNNPPDITFDDASPIIIGVDATSTAVTGQIVADAGLDQVTLFKVVGTTETQIGAAITSFTAGDITTTDKVTYSFRFTVAVTENMSFKITAVDKDNQTSSKSIAIQKSAAGGAIDTWTKTLGGGFSSTGSFFASASGTVYTQSQATSNSSQVDIIYHYGSGGELYAPSNSTIKSTYSLSFGTYNATKFKSTTLTATQFDAVVDDVAILTATAGATADMINVSTSDVVAFVTAAGKNGLLKVVSIVGDNTGTINLVVKVQK